ncbi:hypothetical protein P9705_001243 [Enterococcus faecalis]|nr:hypothetical protein [Enterococcus faecalis]
MAKKNFIVEAAERYRDLKSRGFIPDGERNVYQSFVKEVAAERRGESLIGKYTAAWYKSNTIYKVEYFDRVTKGDYDQAEERYRDLKSRGFIPEKETGVFDEFLKEVRSTKEGKLEVGKYTANWYTDKYHIELEYETTITKKEYVQKYIDYLLEVYKGEFVNCIDKNDFLSLAEQYRGETVFDVLEILSIETFPDLLNLIGKVDRAADWFYRNKHGRNRTTESSDMEAYKNEAKDELNILKAGVIRIINHYKL